MSYILGLVVNYYLLKEKYKLCMIYEDGKYKEFDSSWYNYCSVNDLYRLGRKDIFNLYLKYRFDSKKLKELIKKKKTNWINKVGKKEADKIFKEIKEFIDNTNDL